MAKDRGPKRQQPDGQTSKIGKPSKHRHKPWYARLSWTTLTAVGAVVAAIFLAALLRPSRGLPRSLHPFPGPKLAALSQFAGKHAAKLLWGTYRPGLYFGMRTRTPRSPLFGLMWLDPTNQNALDNIRHEAQQGDNLDKYGWLAHDGESFGRQELLDKGCTIETTWVKESSSALGRDWGARISATHRRSPKKEDPLDNDNAQGGEREQEEQEEESASPDIISFFLYFASEDGSPISLDANTAIKVLGAKGESQKKEGSAAVDAAPPIFKGTSKDTPLGDWTVHMAPSSRDKIKEDSLDSLSSSDSTAPTPTTPEVVSSMTLRTPHFHNLTAAVRQGLVHSLWQQHSAGTEAYTLELPDTVEEGGNVAVLQITARLPFSLDLAFVSEDKDEEREAEGEMIKKARASRAALLMGDNQDILLATAEENFKQRFQETFGSLTGSHLPQGTLSAAQAALSNMLGGMGYWHGHSLVRIPSSSTSSSSSGEKKENGRKKENNGKNKEDKIVPLWDAPLFSATPSRSFFPRGFLWDEGFHQLLIRRWNPALSRDAVAHWLDLMTASGWIAREQILGEEARSRVPSEFLTQHPDAANPPTLFLVLEDMAQRATSSSRDSSLSNRDSSTKDSSKDPKDSSKDSSASNNRDLEAEADLDFLRAAWPRLRTWFMWYNGTQAGPVPGSYRWRGRDAGAVRELNPKTLTSGLDDYPRASHPSDEERHVDLRCWLAVAARAMATVGAAAGAPSEDIALFTATAARLSDFEELLKLHWDSEKERFADWGVHTDDVALAPKLGPDGMLTEPERMNTGTPPRAQFVPHYGYVSLFPLLMGLIPKDAPQLGQQLRLLRDETELWTEHGLRSLSMRSTLYRAHNTPHDAPYWRGAIWINVNYLALNALRRYEAQGGPYAQQAGEAAGALQAALLDTLVKQYNKSGYLWEQYDDDSGEGKGSHPFTGWTALLTLVAAAGNAS